MPKETKSRNQVLVDWVKEFPDFQTDGIVLFCKVCNCTVAAQKKYHCQQHIATRKHIKKRSSTRECSKATFTCNSTTKRQVLFWSFLSLSERYCTHFSICTFNSIYFACPSKNLIIWNIFTILADIPLHKLNNKDWKSFMEKYMNRSMPDDSTIRRNYVKDLYQNVLTKLQE